MATDCLVWLARPSRKRPEVRKGKERPQKTRKCRFNSFCVVVAVVDCIQAVSFSETYYSGATRALESAVIAQTAQKCEQTEPQTKRITPIAQLRTG